VFSLSSSPAPSGPGTRPSGLVSSSPREAR